MPLDISRIGLGTVQFGLNYGVSNNEGIVSLDEVTNILEFAKKAGINTIDTAALYGASETVLGRAIKDHSDFKIVTKTIKIEAYKVRDIELRKVQQEVEQSLVRLSTGKIYGLLLHDVEDIIKPGAGKLINFLNELKATGKVEKIGVSVYNSEQIDKLLELFIPDLIQLPGNILDQRLATSGHLRMLKQMGVEIHMRSVFLQGLLLMPTASLNPYFENIISHLDKYHLYLKECGVTPLQAALGFALSLAEVDKVIVGVCSKSELEEIISEVNSQIPSNFDFKRWRIDDPSILDPSKWCLKEELVQ